MKPPADELQTYSVSVLDSSSVTGTSDSESVTDSNVADGNPLGVCCGGGNVLSVAVLSGSILVLCLPPMSGLFVIVGTFVLCSSRSLDGVKAS